MLGRWGYWIPLSTLIQNITKLDPHKIFLNLTIIQFEKQSNSNHLKFL